MEIETMPAAPEVAAIVKVEKMNMEAELRAALANGNVDEVARLRPLISDLAYRLRAADLWRTRADLRGIEDELEELNQDIEWLNKTRRSRIAAMEGKIVEMEDARQEIFRTDAALNAAQIDLRRCVKRQKELKECLARLLSSAIEHD